MPTKALKSYLDNNHVSYKTVDHPVAYSARETSHVCNVSENALAKTVMVFVGNKLAMVVLPANENINFKSLREALHENDVSLATERDFSPTFKDCELGAMPPFGNLYDMEVYVAKDLANNKEIAFNAGTHTEIIKLAWRDYEKLVRPHLINVAEH